MTVLSKLYRKNKSRTNRVIFVCTIEKANGLFNTFLSGKEDSMYNSNSNNSNSSNSSNSSNNTSILSLGCVVIDEMHMMGDASRGYLLEILVR